MHLELRKPNDVKSYSTCHETLPENFYGILRQMVVLSIEEFFAKKFSPVDGDSFAILLSPTSKSTA